MSSITARKRVPLSKPSFDSAEERLVNETLRSGWVTQGPRVAEFEKLFATRMEVQEAVAVSSGTTALFLALKVLGIGHGDEVIVPSLTYIASANSVVHSGATPVLVDVDPGTLNIDPLSMESAITSRTRAVMPVHQLGLAADLAPIQEIARRHELPIVEDAACAVGARYRGRPIGSSGNLTCFSFHPRKVLVAGEGGMITTSDSELAARMRRLRHQGMTITDLERFRSKRVLAETFPEIGYNLRLSDLHAAVGIVQLEKLDRFLERLATLGGRYDTELGRLPGVEVRTHLATASPTYQSYISRLQGVSCDERDEVLDLMLERGIATKRGLMAVHQEPCYRDTKIARCPVSLHHTEQAAAQTMLIPMYPDLSDADQAFVLSQLAEILEQVFSWRVPSVHS